MSKRTTPSRSKIDRFMRLPEVLAVTGLARSTLYTLMSKECFPRARKTGERTCAWRESEIKRWIATRPVA